MSRPAQLPLRWPHHASSEREDLVVGEANRLAVAAVDSWPDWPHPILYVVGPAGSGKSHLCAAWAARSGAGAFSPERFHPQGPRFCLFVDDVERARLGEGDLFALLNAARLGGGTLLLTSRLRPSELPFSTPDLRSRLNAATVVALGPPDEALLGGVLAKLFADRQIEFDARLLPTILPRMERSLDAARRLVERIDAETLASKGRLTRRLVLDLLSEGGAADDKNAEPVVKPN